MHTFLSITHFDSIEIARLVFNQI